MTTSPLLIGLDIGTTTIKAIVFAANGQLMAEASVATPTHYPRPTWAYYNPTEIWGCTVTVLRQAIEQLDETNQIVSLAVASMGEAAVPVDVHGQPTYEAIAWFDQRTQPQRAWLEKHIGREALFNLTGLSLEPIFGLCKQLWFKENESEAYARTVYWLNMADYIAYRLCGVPATDYSLASRTLALDLQNLCWAKEMILEVGLRPKNFALLHPSGTGLGPLKPEAAQETGLPVSTLVSTGGHDHVCGALAAGVTEPGTMLDSMGTAEAIFIPLKQPVLEPQMAQQGYTQGVHVLAGRYYVFGGLYASGGSVSWWRDIVGQNIDYETLIFEAKHIPCGSLGTVFLPHLRQANSPNNDAHSRGAFIGLTTDVKRGVMFRAVLEGIAYEAHQSLTGLEAYPSVESPRQIYVTGGSTRNELLLQIKADIFNRVLHVSPVTEATCLGAALLGGLGAGVYANVEAALEALTDRHRQIRPQPDQAAQYALYYRQVYQKVYHALREVHHAIVDGQGLPLS